MAEATPLLVVVQQDCIHDSNKMDVHKEFTSIIHVPDQIPNIKNIQDIRPLLLVDGKALD